MKDFTTENSTFLRAYQNRRIGPQNSEGVAALGPFLVWWLVSWVCSHLDRPFVMWSVMHVSSQQSTLIYDISEGRPVTYPFSEALQLRTCRRLVCLEWSKAFRCCKFSRPQTMERILCALFETLVGWNRPGLSLATCRLIRKPCRM